LLTLNVPIQIDKCTTRRACTPAWEPLSYQLIQQDSYCWPVLPRGFILCEKKQEWICRNSSTRFWNLVLLWDWSECSQCAWANSLIKAYLCRLYLIFHTLRSLFFMQVNWGDASSSLGIRWDFRVSKCKVVFPVASFHNHLPFLSLHGVLNLESCRAVVKLQLDVYFSLLENVLRECLTFLFFHHWCCFDYWLFMTYLYNVLEKWILFSLWKEKGFLIVSA